MKFNPIKPNEGLESLDAVSPPRRYRHSTARCDDCGKRLTMKRELEADLCWWHLKERRRRAVSDRI